jgi:hypothetical protein
MGSDRFNELSNMESESRTKQNDSDSEDTEGSKASEEGKTSKESTDRKDRKDRSDRSDSTDSTDSVDNPSDTHSETTTTSTSEPDTQPEPEPEMQSESTTQPTPGDIHDTAFDYSEAKQSPLYARPSTWEAFDDALELDVERSLRKQEVRNASKRELHDATLRVAAENPELVAEMLLEIRRQG